MPSGILKKPLPYLALILANVIWGVSLVAAKIALREFPTMSLIFVRFALASILIYPFILATPHKIKLKLEHLPVILLTGLTLITFNILFLYEGLTRTTAIDASSISMLVPIISVFCGWVFLKEKIYWINLLGILLGLVGALVVGGLPLIFLGNVNPEMMFGNFLVFLSGVSTVAGSILSKEILKKYSTLFVTASVFVIATLSFAVPTITEFQQDPSWISKVTILGLLAVLYLAILSSVSAYFLFEWALGKVDVTQANIFQYILPAVTASVAVPLLGERISYSFIVGTVLVVLGVYWGTLGKIHHHHLHHRHHRV